MSPRKNFYYRINPESVLSEIISVNQADWLQWFIDFFNDLRNDCIENTKTELAAVIIKEAHSFREKRSAAGRISAEQRATYVQQMEESNQQHSTSVKQMSTYVEQCSTSNSNSNSNNKEKIKNLSASDESVSDCDWISKKKRKLEGKRLDTFKLFWEAFDYKKSRAEAMDAWMEIPQLTDSLVEKILKAASREAERRPRAKQEGKTPKMAQGWISGRRWEDEEETEVPAWKLI